MSDTNFLHAINPSHKKNATAKLFQLTSLSCALALAGCGGGDGTVDAIAPKPDLGITGSNGGTGSGSTGGNGGTTQPTKEPAFYIQKLTPSLENIKLTDKQETQEITVVVKALQKKTAGAMVGKEVTLAVIDSEKLGISIAGNSTQTTGADGNATYKLVFNPKAVTDETLLLKGINLTATAKAQDGSVVEQVAKIGVSKEGSTGSVVQSKLNLTSSVASTTLLSSGEINARGDTVTVSVQAKQTNGVAAEGVDITLGIGSYKGISIIDGGKKQTNSSGEAQFTLVVDPNLSDAERNNLIQKGITYNIKLTEQDGAEKQESGIWTVRNPASSFNINVSGNTDLMSAYGDQQTIHISAIPKSDKVLPIQGSTVKVALNNTGNLPKGVSLSRDLLVLNEQGQATLDLVIPKGLSKTDAEYLKNNGISYTLTLIEPNHADTSVTVKSKVYIPEAQYQVSVDSIDKKAISSAGGSTQISFRVNNKNNGAPVVGQKVVASLSDKFKATGLVTLDNAAEQTTDSQGIVTYTVRIPTGLTKNQRANLESLGKKEKLKLEVSITEPTGVPTPSVSQSININSSDADSAIQLTSKASVSAANAQGDTFTIAVSAVQQGGAAVIGDLVKLQLSSAAGVRITGGNTQQTNDQGIATFTLRVDSGLNKKERADLIKSGINYTAVLTASDGTQYKLNTQTVKVAEKKATIIIKSASQINELGGSANIIVKALEGSPAKVAVGKEVRIELTNAARQAGVSLVANTATTDKDGQAIFVVSVPSGLSKAVREELKTNGIKYQISYDNDGIMAEPQDGEVVVTPVTVNFKNLDAAAQYEINNTGGSQSIEFQLFNEDKQGNKIPARNQAVNFAFNNPGIAKLLTVNGARGSSVVSANTNNDGIVSFNVLVPSNLTLEQRKKLNNTKLTATLTETLTGQTQKVAVTVKSVKSEIELKAQALGKLNLNGGETQIRVVAHDKKGDVVSGQSVALALPSRLAQAGLMVVSSPNQTTNNSGVATFTIAAPNNLTSSQKKMIGSSFDLGIAARDANNNSSSTLAKVVTEEPSTATEVISTIVANKVVDSKGDTFKVFVRVEDVNSQQGVVGQQVTLNIKDPIKTGVRFTGSNKVATNSQGVAEFDLQLVTGSNVDPTVLGKGIKVEASTVSANGVVAKKEYNIAVDQSTIDSYVIMGFADKTELNTGGDQTNVTFRVVDKNGGALAGVPVQLKIKDAETSGAALTTKSQLITDEQGLVKAGLVLGAGSVYARLNHGITVVGQVLKPEYKVQPDGTTSVEMVAQVEKEVNLYASGTTTTLTASKTNLKPNEKVSFTTSIVDGAGNPVAGAEVEWVDMSDPKHPSVISVIATAQTDRDGKVTSKEIDEAALPFDSNGNLKVAARVKGNDTVSNSIALVQVSQAGISFNDIQAEYEVHKTNTINIQIRAKDAADALAYKGKEVTVETTLGSFANGIPTGSKVIEKVTITQAMIDATDKSIINVPVKLSSGLAGTAVLTAFVTNTAGNKQTTTVDTYFRATTPAKMLLQPVKSVIVPGGSTEIVALVKDKNDVPVKGVVVVFSRTKESSTGRLSAATAITNEKGEAKVVYTANAVSPINGVEIQAQLLDDKYGIGTKTTYITVSKDAVYTTLAFSDKIEKSDDNIYYLVSGSIAVMDGTGRPVKNTEVSLKSYATAYRQGLYCAVERSIAYQPKEEINPKDGTITIPEVQEFSSIKAEKFASGWQDTEDGNWNYILDNNEDKNNSKKLEAINPVTILGTTLADDKYTFVTDNEGKVDFKIRYPKAYSNWTQVRFDATTLLNGSENLQSFDIELPAAISDFSLSGDTIITPYTNNESAFGVGSQVCINQLAISVDARTGLERTVITGSAQGLDSGSTLPVILYKDNSPVRNTNITAAQPGFVFNFNNAFDKGTLVTVQVGSSSISQVIKTKK
ncbi:hypothetical protein [Psychrobacter sp. I-STPA10]|uniref:hypothetical protein n=1 Tax=Psychrobacter sp. I-STPA10 TaxID=2585769 RepID=UPI001E2B92DC|nr:hypothetical protein [Psychrobacter sp. I-STPA10]